MKKVLKGWLIDNSVTTDNKTDKILLLASAGSLTLDDVQEEMYKQDTGLRPETLHHSVTLYHRVLMDLILNGYSVNTGLFRAVAQLTGVIEGGVWNKERNSIYVSLTQDKVLREEIAKTSVEILGEKSNIMYILETEDKKTGLKDGSATAGRNFFVRSAMLKVVGDDESVGVTLTNAAKFTKNGTITLQFEVEKEKNRVLFAVADTGCGIPKEKQKQVFERFEKLNEYAQGTGLGLSICKLTVDKWGGDIWIDPDYEGGARFVVSHPL
jgi:hypothetical protein